MEGWGIGVPPRNPVSGCESRVVVGKNGKFGKFCDLRRILEIFGSCVRWRVLEVGEFRESLEAGVRFPCSECGLWPFPKWGCAHLMGKTGNSAKLPELSGLQQDELPVGPTGCAA